MRNDTDQELGVLRRGSASGISIPDGLFPKVALAKQPEEQLIHGTNVLDIPSILSMKYCCRRRLWGNIVLETGVNRRACELLRYCGERLCCQCKPSTFLSFITTPEQGHLWSKIVHMSFWARHDRLDNPDIKI
jgi:hypothetical protein